MFQNECFLVKEQSPCQRMVNDEQEKEDRREKRERFNIQIISVIALILVESLPNN